MAWTLSRPRGRTPEQKRRSKCSPASYLTPKGERRAIARELHDELGQALQALKINLQTVQRFPQNSGQRVEESIAIVDNALQQVRTSL